MKSLGKRAVDVAMRELGVRAAIYGKPNTSDRVREYLAPCVRDLDGDGEAERLGLKSGDWCAAFASWCMLQAWEDGCEFPHEYRAGVVEIVADARKRGAWHDVEEVRSGKWTPSKGDLLIWDRRDPKRPSTSWWRHVNRLIKYDPIRETLQTIGGNEGRAVRTAVHELAAPKLLGFVSYSSADPVEVTPEQREEDLQLIAAFVEAHRQTL